MTGQFRKRVDSLIALVRQRGTLTVDAAAYELDLSPNYMAKAAKAAVALSDIICVRDYLYSKSEYDKRYRVQDDSAQTLTP